MYGRMVYLTWGHLDMSMDNSYTQCNIWGFLGNENSSYGPLKQLYPTTLLHSITTQGN